MDTFTVSRDPQFIEKLEDIVGLYLNPTTAGHRVFGGRESQIQALDEARSEYQDKALRNLPAKRVQCDEIWSFVGAKDKNLPTEKQGKFGFGSVWTWTAIDADSKLMCSWMVGTRDSRAAYDFMQDLAGRLKNRVQLTTDGHKPYLEAVENTFGDNIDYAMLVKIYGETQESEKRYSPAQCMGAKKEEITGKPDPRHISTSYVERQNLTMRFYHIVWPSNTLHRCAPA